MMHEHERVLRIKILSPAMAITDAIDPAMPSKTSPP
jgi:hypothetical protein